MMIWESARENNETSMHKFMGATIFLLFNFFASLDRSLSILPALQGF